MKPVLLVVLFALVYPTTGWSHEAVMATINGSDEYTWSGPMEGDEVRLTIEPGERFLATQLTYGEKDWQVYLMSGITGIIPHDRIRVLPDEPLISKESWRKL